MLNKVEILILLFFIYSILGWIMEMVITCIGQKKYINRGFLIGPYCPIYGVGVVLITSLLHKYQSNIFIIFIFTIIICGLLEYFTGYILERCFNARWWDYSKRKFNINGRVCLSNLLAFGILGCFIIYISNPFFISILSKVSKNSLNILNSLLIICMGIDIVISANVIWRFRSIYKDIRKEAKDDTEEITEQVRQFLQGKLTLQNRLVCAFPNVKECIGSECKCVLERTKKECCDCNNN